MIQMAMLLRYFLQLSKLCRCVSFWLIYFFPLIWSPPLDFKGKGLLGISINKANELVIQMYVLFIISPSQEQSVALVL